MVQPDFDVIKHIDPYGKETWSARELMPLLGYGKNWRNFEYAIEKAKIACGESGSVVSDHFDASVKMVKLGSGSERNTSDYILSRLACYLIAMNGNPRKTEVAAAQQYFAVSTRAHQLEQLRMSQEERLEKRLKVSKSYKSLSSAATNAGVKSGHMGIFMDAGNVGLYGITPFFPCL